MKTDMLGKRVTGKCDQCGVEIHPAKDEAAFARNKGLHMRNAHGIVGKWRQRLTKHTNGTMDITAVEERKKAELRQYKKDWWKRNKARLYKYKKKQAEPTVQLPETRTVDPCKLSECPHCGTRFYMIKGS